MSRASRGGHDKHRPTAPTRVTRSFKVREARWQRERRWRRMVLALGLFAVVVIIAVPALGYLNETFRVPSHKLALKVGDTVFDWGYFAKYFRATQPAISEEAMRQSLAELRDDELLRQDVGKLGITATAQDVQKQMKANFKVTADTALDEALRQKLKTAGLSRTEYEAIVRAQVLRLKLREQLGQGIPAQADQVHVAAIVLNSRTDAEAALTRIQGGEDFALVAKELSQDEATEETGGDLGWVPKGLVELAAVGEVRLKIMVLPSAEEAKIATDRLSQGEDFGALARELSQDEATKEKGGDLGWVPTTALGQSLTEAIKDLKPGEVSQVVATGSQAVLVQLMERSPSGLVVDDIAFGMEPGSLNLPLLTLRGYYVIKLLEKAEGRPVEEATREKQKDRALAEWLAKAAKDEKGNVRWTWYEMEQGTPRLEWMKQRLGSKT